MWNPYRWGLPGAFCGPSFVRSNTQAIMKNSILIIAVLMLVLSACRKEYVCVCTQKSTGDKSYGDHFKAGSIEKKAYEESCEANDDVFSSDLENCHLE